MPFAYIETLTPAACHSQPDALFIFGDNLEGWGRKGQAVIRDCQNAVGIPTKRKPSMAPDAFFSDTDLPRLEPKFQAIRNRLLAHLERGGHVYWPQANIGTGLAGLESRAPAIFARLNEIRVDFEARFPVRQGPRP